MANVELISKNENKHKKFTSVQVVIHHDGWSETKHGRVYNGSSVIKFNPDSGQKNIPVSDVGGL